LLGRHPAYPLHSVLGMELTTTAVPAVHVPHQAESAPAADLAADPAADSAVAPEILDELMARLGVDGLVAVLNSPSLRLSVDDHAAEVRAALAERGLTGSVQGLAGYATLLVRAAHDCGRELPADPAGYDWDAAQWCSADWYLVRLLAVCALAVGLA
jgi:Family of unknown function (DUF6401)